MLWVIVNVKQHMMYTPSNEMHASSSPAQSETKGKVLLSEDRTLESSNPKLPFQHEWRKPSEMTVLRKMDDMDFTWIYKFVSSSDPSTTVLSRSLIDWQLVERSWKPAGMTADARAISLWFFSCTVPCAINMASPAETNTSTIRYYQVSSQHPFIKRHSRFLINWLIDWLIGWCIHSIQA